MKRLWPALIALVPLTVHGLGEASPPVQARQDWILHCQGCHGVQGGLRAPGMPAIQGQVARYLSVEGGRAYLVRVPGAANAPLSDARLAATLNWMLETFDAEHLPADFEAFTGDEVAVLRGQGLTAGARRILLERLRQRADSPSGPVSPRTTDHREGRP